MQKSIKVNIAGKEYSLRGENEDIIYQAANEVNSQLEILRGKSGESLSGLSMLAALNIAEKYYSDKKQKDVDLNFLSNEIKQMVDYLSKPVETTGYVKQTEPD